MIPDAFNKLSNAFHQDTHLFFTTLDEAIQDAIHLLTNEEQKASKVYLDELLSGKYNDEQLVALWDKTLGGSGGFGISRGEEGDAARFLGQLRFALETSLVSRKVK